MKDSYEQRIQNQFGAFCVKVLKNEARYIQREYARLRDQEKSLGELTASELEQTAVWDKHFMDEHVFDVQGLPVVVTGDLLADALAQLPEGKRDVILLSYFLDMTDREISDKLNIVHQTVSKRRLTTLKELREYLMKEGFEWPVPVILAAVNGDEDALAAVVAHYQKYIRALATRPLKDEYGNTYLYVDEDMRLRLETKLIHSIVTGFKVQPV